jgi:hypothetical protein
MLASGFDDDGSPVDMGNEGVIGSDRVGVDMKTSFRLLCNRSFRIIPHLVSLMNILDPHLCPLLVMMPVHRGPIATIAAWWLAHRLVGLWR